VGNMVGYSDVGEGFEVIEFVVRAVIGVKIRSCCGYRGRMTLVALQLQQDDIGQ
jgi:hypothetical protein